MYFKLIAMVMLSFVAQPIHGSESSKSGLELSKQVLQAGAAVTFVGALGVSAVVAIQNYRHQELYYRSLAAKLSKVFPESQQWSRKDLEQYRNEWAAEDSREMVELEQKESWENASRLVGWYTQCFFFRNGIPTRGGSVTKVSQEKKLSAAICYGSKDNGCALNNYSLIISRSLHDAVSQVLNPLCRLQRKSVNLVLRGDIARYRIETTLLPSFMLEIYHGILLHEGQHILDQVYKQVEVGVDITEKANEINGDNNIRDQNLLSAAIFYTNILKLERIYFAWACTDRITEAQEKDCLQRYSKIYSRLLKDKVGVRNYDPEDFHPCENERLEFFEKRWQGSTQNRIVPVTVYYQEPGKEQAVVRTFNLEEEKGWEVQF